MNYFTNGAPYSPAQPTPLSSPLLSPMSSPLPYLDHRLYIYIWRYIMIYSWTLSRVELCKQSVRERRWLCGVSFSSPVCLKTLPFWAIYIIIGTMPPVNSMHWN